MVFSSSPKTVRWNTFRFRRFFYVDADSFSPVVSPQSLDCRVGGWLCDLRGERDQNRVFDALETPEEGVGNAHAVESNDCVSPLSPLVYLHCRCVGSDSDVGQFAGFGRMGLAIPLQRVHCRFQRRRPLRQELLRLLPAVLPDRSRVALRLRGDRVCDVVGSHRRLLLQSFFMENDLDCFESSQDHIHVRNAGIIDELGHVTSTRLSLLSRRHVLSDKTGTITENNLRVVSLATPTKEYDLVNLRNDADAQLSLLLLNMVSNHSALSIRNAVSSDLTDFACSISQAQSKTLMESPHRSSSFSEIIIASNAEESSHEWIQPISEENVQVFCSSQDERVFPLLSHHHRPFWTRSRASATSSESGDRTNGNWTLPFTAFPT